MGKGCYVAYQANQSRRLSVAYVLFNDVLIYGSVARGQAGAALAAMTPAASGGPDEEELSLLDRGLRSLAGAAGALRAPRACRARARRAPRRRTRRARKPFGRRETVGRRAARRALHARAQRALSLIHI